MLVIVVAGASSGQEFAQNSKEHNDKIKQIPAMLEKGLALDE